MRGLKLNQVSSSDLDWKILTEYSNILKTNSFGFLRLLLAGLVVFQHSFVLTGFEEYSYVAGSNLVNLGSLGVCGFFGISGFLLINSAYRLDPKSFIFHRIFRIFPAFYFNLLLTSFVILPIYLVASGMLSEINTLTFLREASRFVFANAGLVVFQDNVGDIFSTNPYPGAVNGSLWTLAPEFICYLLLITIVTISLIKGFKIEIVIFAGILAGLILINLASDLSLLTYISPALELGISFGVGAIFGKYIQRSSQRPGYIAITFLLLLNIASLYLEVWRTFGLILWVLLVIFIGLALQQKLLSSIGRKNDVSYGLYLYHFTIIQVLVALMSPNSIQELYFLIASTFAISLVFAFISWKFIEFPALKFSKSKFTAFRTRVS